MSMQSRLRVFLTFHSGIWTNKALFASGRPITPDDRVVRLRILDQSGVVCFDFDRRNGAPSISRSKAVVHRGVTVGLVDIALSEGRVKEGERRILGSGIVLSLVVVLVLAIATGLIFRVVVIKPLNALGNLVRAYGAGRYQNGELDTPIKEFRPLIEVLVEMGAEIKTQMGKLSDAEKKYRSIVENAVEGIFQITEQGRFLGANPALARTLGYEFSAELVNRPLEALAGLSVVPSQWDDFIRAMRAGKTVSGFYIELRHKSGDTVHASIHARGVFGDDGVFLFAEGILEDISERTRAAEEYARLEEQLRHAQKLEAIGTLAGGIAHDFNNILTPIIGHAELALMQLAEGHPVREDMNDLLMAATRARDLVNQILVISRRGARVPLAPVFLGPLVLDICRLLRASFSVAIEIRTEISPNCAPVLGDVSQLHQVLLNLGTNACQSMEAQGGVLTVSLTQGADGIFAGRWVRICVRDTGTGMPPEVVRHIFEPYFTTKTAGKGSGLGLAVAHGIVTKLGGEILVKSEPGKGTSFEVLLPEAIGTVLPSRPETSTPHGRGQHILVVDDEPAVRAVAAGMLKSFGYRVTECPGASKALELFRDTPNAFDALLTDYHMPGLNGLDLADEILRLRPGLPVILGTGFSAPLAQATIAAHGLRALILKPYTMKGLSEAVYRALAPGESPAS